jgi:CheY-like chemotaxis protein/tetratricopeptide (TPR) repeat protein
VTATVLCIESDPVLCQLLARSLSQHGLQVTEAAEAVRALAASLEDPPDLVLLSVDLAGGNGLAPLQALRELPEGAARIPVILLCDRPPLAEEAGRAAELGVLALLTKPVPLRKLLAVVDEALAKAGQIPSAEPSAREPGPGVSGSLERMPFPFLLHHLHGLRADGVLHLVDGRKRKWLQLRGGQPVGVRSNLVSECLGNFLVRSRRIDAQTLAESRRQMGDGRLQGEILVAMQALTESELSAALAEQAEEKFFEIFAWEGGEFCFERESRLHKSTGLPGGRSTASWILRGVRTRTPIERIDATLERRADRVLVRTQSPFTRFQELDLEPELRHWVEGLDGVPLSRALDADEDGRRCLYALLATGVLTLRLGDGAAAAVRARERTKPAPPAPEPEWPARSELPHPDEGCASEELAALAGAMENRDPFEILGVPETASEAEIRSAYERLSERAHPDRVAAASEAVRGLAEQVFGRVEAAFEALRDPRRRQEHLLARRRAGREAAALEQGRRAGEALLAFQRGEAALRQRAYDDALRCFESAVELHPEEGEYHAYLGWALYCRRPDDRKAAEAALRHIKRGIKLASDREKPYLFMGRVCNAIGRSEVAVKMFTRAVQIQPECVEALRELRLIHMRREKERGFIARILRR